MYARYISLFVSISKLNFNNVHYNFNKLHFISEHALPLMQKVFELGVNSNVNTIPYINKTIALLNTQQGC